MAFPETVKFNYRLKFADQAELQDIRFIESRILDVFSALPVCRVDVPGQAIFIESKHSLFSFKYQCKINYSLKGTEPKILAEISLIELIKVIVFVCVAGALLASFSFSAYLWFIFIFSVVAYVVNVTFIRMFLIERFDKAFNQDVEETDELASKQKQWMKNTNVCPACGELLTQYDAKCPECGISLGNQIKTKEFDVSKYSEKSLLYHYKPNKNNK